MRGRMRTADFGLRIRQTVWETTEATLQLWKCPAFKAMPGLGIIRRMETLAQHGSELLVDPGAPDFWKLGPLLVLPWLFSLLSLLYTAFWLWMVVHCIRYEPDKVFWIWVMLIVPFVGVIVYAAVRYFPASDHPAPEFLRRWLRSKDLARLEAAAEQIGNAHQFIQWGDALRDVGRWPDAGSAYNRALQKDPENLQALWGAALVAEQDRRHEDVVSLCRRILDKDPQYKFGDVSLAYGKALAALRRDDEARTHFEQHIRRWRHPEGLYLLAALCQTQGDAAGARQHLRSLLQDLNASPTAIARKHGRWRSRGRQLLRKLPAE